MYNVEKTDKGKPIEKWRRKAIGTKELFYVRQLPTRDTLSSFIKF
jgi:hypothetical protein